MTVFLTWLIRAIGIGGCAFLGLWIYDWRIPGASRIPYLSSIPIIGDLTTGRTHSYAADQVKMATAGMVSKYERDVLAAQLAKERRDRESAEIVATEAMKRALSGRRTRQTKRSKPLRLQLGNTAWRHG